MSLNQTKVLAQIKEALATKGYAFGKNIKKDNSRRAFDFGESWATAGFGTVTDKTTIKPIEDVYKRVIGHIVIQKNKVPGFSGWTKIYVCPGSQVAKGVMVWDSDGWFLNLNMDELLDYLEKENA